MSLALEAQDAFDRAVARVRAGELLAFPTETVWGLGADARSPAAVDRLRRWKRTRQPLSILVAGPEALHPLGLEVPDWVDALITRFWPGPLTLVLRGSVSLAPGIAAAGEGVGVRCSSHPVAATLAARLEAEGVGPLTATSLNRHGEPPAATREAARRRTGHGREAPLWLDLPGPDAGGGAASTVVDATGPRGRVIREGAIAAAELEPWLARGADR